MTADNVIQIEKLKDYPLERLSIAESNSKLHPPSQVAQLASDIEAFGFLEPIVATPDGEIIAGAGRFMALLHLGRTVCPALWKISGLSPAKVKAMRELDNKLAADTGWIKKFLQFEIEFLEDSGVSLSDFGLDLSPSELFDAPAKQTATDINYIKSIFFLFPNGVFEKVIDALHGMIQEDGSLASNTDAFLFLLDKYGPVAN